MLPTRIMGITALAVVVLAAFLMNIHHMDASEEAAHWGTYRPNIYTGFRATHPHSPLIGLMWYSHSHHTNTQQHDPNYWFDHIRHDCEERDGMSRYGWLQHNGEHYGRHEVLDTVYGVNITVTFVQPRNASGAVQRDRWIARIHGQAINPTSEPTSIALVWYTSLTQSSHSMSLNATPKKGLTDDIKLKLNIGKLGSSTLTQTRNSHNTYPSYEQPSKTGRKGKTTTLSLSAASFVGLSLEKIDDTWNAKESLRQSLGRDWQHQHQQRQKHKPQPKPNEQPEPDPHPIIPQLSNTWSKNSNLMMIQQFYTVPFDVEFMYIPDGDDGKWTEDKHVDELIVNEQTALEQRWEQTFQLEQKGYSPSQRAFALAALSNMIGGIGYFYGTQLVETAPAKGDKPAVISTTPPSSLFCNVPSRSFFPRGFMWDEGFHQLLVSEWSLDLSLSILRSWFAQIYTDTASDSSWIGWLPREQILGDEARRRVPAEFQVQKPYVGNPPTMLLTLYKIMLRLRAQSNSADYTMFASFAHDMFPIIQQHVEWFLRTQSSTGDGYEKTEGIATSYRWGGRSIDHCLASGLDDYPRAPYMGDENGDREGHVDLHSWMIRLMQVMAEMTKILGETEEESNRAMYLELSATYASRARLLLSKLDTLHWNEKTHTYCDYVIKNGTRRWIAHTGYISLFPFLLGLLPHDSIHLNHTLHLVGDTTRIWTQHGLLSLSRRDRQFGTKEDYWRGHIWININYLAVQALRIYSGEPDSHVQVKNPELLASNRALASRLYHELRDHVITNIYNNYERTGYLWEQYHQKDGRGRKSHPFTGWTALVVLMMAEK